jgi:hypothetical protein
MPRSSTYGSEVEALIGRLLWDEAWGSPAVILADIMTSYHWSPAGKARDPWHWYRAPLEPLARELRLPLVSFFDAVTVELGLPRGPLMQCRLPAEEPCEPHVDPEVVQRLDLMRMVLYKDGGGNIHFNEVRYCERSVVMMGLEPVAACLACAEAPILMRALNVCVHVIIR